MFLLWFVFVDWFPDQNPSAGPWSRLHLSGTKGRSSADHPV